MRDLSGQVVMVVGASGGLGMALTQSLSDAKTTALPALVSASTAALTPFVSGTYRMLAEAVDASASMPVASTHRSH